MEQERSCRRDFPELPLLAYGDKMATNDGTGTVTMNELEDAAFRHHCLKLALWDIAPDSAHLPGWGQIVLGQLDRQETLMSYLWESHQESVMLGNLCLLVIRQLQRSFDALVTRTGNLERSLDALVTRTRNLELSMDALVTRTGNLQRSMDALVTRTGNLERLLDDQKQELLLSQTDILVEVRKLLERVQAQNGVLHEHAQRLF